MSDYTYQIGHIGQTLAGIRHELKETRAELADIAAAIRELAGAVQDLHRATVTARRDDCGCVWRGSTRVETCPIHRRRWWRRRR